MKDPYVYGSTGAALHLRKLMLAREEKPLVAMVARRLTHLSRLLNEAKRKGVSREMKYVIKRHCIDEAYKQDPLGRLTDLERCLMRNIIVGRTRKLLEV